MPVPGWEQCRPGPQALSADLLDAEGPRAGSVPRESESFERDSSAKRASRTGTARHGEVSGRAHFHKAEPAPGPVPPARGGGAVILLPERRGGGNRRAPSRAMTSFNFTRSTLSASNSQSPFQSLSKYGTVGPLIPIQTGTLRQRTGALCLGAELDSHQGALEPKTWGASPIATISCFGE